MANQGQNEFQGNPDDVGGLISVLQVILFGALLIVFVQWALYEHAVHSGQALKPTVAPTPSYAPSGYTLGTCGGTRGALVPCLYKKKQ